MNTIPNEHLIKLIEAGIQAPSADNGQPWKFKLLNDGFELWLDPANMGLFFDVNQVATQISCGAVIENVVNLANSLGLATHISYFDQSMDAQEGASKFAQFNFTSTGNKIDISDVKESIFNRHSNRNLFQFNKKISEPIIDQLSSLVHANSNYYLHSYQAPKDKKSIIHIITNTDIIRFVHKQVHDDFYKVLRFGNAAKQTRDGLAAANLGIESFMIPILEFLKPWKLTKFLNHFGLHRIMALRGTWLPLKSSSHIISIVHKGPANYVESGRIIQRFWIAANKAGLSVQAWGSMPLFLARLHLTQGKGFTLDQIKTLSSLEDDFVKVTTEFNKETDQFIMLFRLGYHKKPAGRSYRRPIDTFLIEQ